MIETVKKANGEKDVRLTTEVKKQLVKFGYSDTSFTLFFQDQSWIKTQLHNENWPDTDKILSVESKQIPIPEGFYKALLAATIRFRYSGYRM